MKALDHALHLRELSQELVQAAEKRAGLKTTAVALQKARRTGSTTAKQKQLRAQIQELSQKIESLVDKIGQPSPRRMERWAGVLPISLQVEARGRKFEHPASTLDMSDRGMRIVTTTSLIPGQTLHVYSNRSHIGHCRVVWVAGAGTDRPSEAGLEILR